MKNFTILLLSFALISVLTSGQSRQPSTIDPDDISLAKVNRMAGYFIFTDCTPVQEYEYLGEVKGSNLYFGSSQYEGNRDRLIKLVQKKYPKADGIILRLHDGGTDKADAILFKK